MKLQWLRHTFLIYYINVEEFRYVNNWYMIRAENLCFVATCTFPWALIFWRIRYRVWCWATLWLLDSVAPINWLPDAWPESVLSCHCTGLDPMLGHFGIQEYLCEFKRAQIHRTLFAAGHIILWCAISTKYFPYMYGIIGRILKRTMLIKPLAIKTWTKQGAHCTVPM